MLLLLLFVFIIAGVESYSVEGQVTVGDLPTLHHGVSGTVIVVNQTNLLIKNFAYDGTAPDAFFWVGTEGTPGSLEEGPTWDHTAILAHPFTGQHYAYTDTTYPILGPYDGEDVLLTLPPRLQVSDLRWISVWCKAFTIDFGSLVFPDDLFVDSDDSNEGTVGDEVEHDYSEDEVENEKGNSEEEEEEEEDEAETETDMGSYVMNIISSVQNAIVT